MTIPFSTTTPALETETAEPTTQVDAWWKALSGQQRRAIQELYASVIREHEGRVSDGGDDNNSNQEVSTLPKNKNQEQK